MSHKRLAALAAMGVIGMAGVVGCYVAIPLAPFPVAEEFDAEFVVYGALRPAALAVADDGRLFYCEKETGCIRVVVDGELQEQPFADVPVNYAGERGLIGIALHPDFATNGRVYVFYTRSDTGADTNDVQAVVDNRVVYFQASGSVAAGGEVFLASLPTSDTGVHVGGKLGFDVDDNTLYVLFGDLGAPSGAQNDNTLYGKVLRYNDDGTTPDDNPVANWPVYAKGLRSPQGIAFDTSAGSDKAFIVERVSDVASEINLLLPSANYGWPQVVGVVDTAAEDAFAYATPNHRQPILATGARESRQFAGVAVNPSGQYGPNVFEHVFFGDSDNGRIVEIGLTTERNAVESETLFASDFRATISDVKFSKGGTLFVATPSAVLKIVPR